uniref:G_PROTEIN_RECEP_F1_2 domain-containing protein n=1 Tax=Strongyloides stercoralis TaxID=6248 RepID=A0A0K0E770_STRER
MIMEKRLFISNYNDTNIAEMLFPNTDSVISFTSDSSNYKKMFEETTKFYPPSNNVFNDKNEIFKNGNYTFSCNNQLCIILPNILIAIFLIFLILLTIFGNILVVLSVIVYKRMRTFTNILLTSLATSDLLVGLMVMPLSLIDLLYYHQWPFNALLCKIWATTDVLLCTASILNLCIISIDRYLAITYPLKYSRTRSKTMAFCLLSAVWGLSFIVCSPPWIIPSWKMDTSIDKSKNSCSYPPSITYRIYSALGSFYIPLLVMLSVYFKIFRVASTREAMIREGLGTCRLSKNASSENKKLKKTSFTKSVQFLHSKNQNTNYRNKKCKRNLNSYTTGQLIESEYENNYNYASTGVYCSERKNSTNSLQYPVIQRQNFKRNKNGVDCIKNTKYMYRHRVERDCSSLTDLTDENKSSEKDTYNGNVEEIKCNQINNNLIIDIPKISDDYKEVQTLVKKAQMAYTKLQPNNLLAKAQSHYNTYGPGRIIRGSKEKMVYLRERKALKTIGIVVMGFIICWMPFFILYLIEVIIDDLNKSTAFGILNVFFLWLGYSNSVLNPIIYTMYNGDFRRCFRDLLTFGCLSRQRRTMSVRKLHQQSTTF